MELDTGAVLGAFAALVALLGPIAILVTKLTDLVRNVVDPTATNLPKATWSVVPLVIGVAICLLWEFNVMGTFVELIPAFDDTSMDGAWGSILTGLAAGAVAGGWHEKFAKNSAMAHEADAEAGVHDTASYRTTRTTRAGTDPNVS